MRDEQTIGALDLILLTSVRSLVAKKPTFHEDGLRIRDLRGLRHDKPGDFDLKRTLKISVIVDHAMKVASKSQRAVLPDTKPSDIVSALERLVVDGWLMKPSQHADAYMYTHGVGKN